MEFIKANTKLILGLIIAALIVFMFIFRFATLKPETVPLSIKDVQQRDGIPVDIAFVENRLLETRISVVGNVEGIGGADIFSQVPMRIKRIHVRPGSKVRRNQLLVTLDPLSGANFFANFQAASIRYTDANTNLERLRSLFEAGAISLSDWEAAQSRVETARAAVEDFNSMIQLRSPISGTITRILKKQGDMVDPGVAIMSVTTTETLKLVANVSQKDITGVSVGAYVDIYRVEDGEKDVALSGKVSEVALEAEPDSRLFRVEIIFDGETASLKAGTLQRASIVTQHIENAVALPARALIEVEGKNYVFVVVDNNASFTPVTVGVHSGTWVQIIDGVGNGDIVVTDGFNQLRREGDNKVMVHKENSLANPSPDSPQE